MNRNKIRLDSTAGRDLERLPQDPREVRTIIHSGDSIRRAH